MSGAKLQTVGQIRDSFPFMVSIGKRIRLTMTPSNMVPKTKINVSDIHIPFDTGPDKSARVFIAINNVNIFQSADIYTPTAPSITGTVYYLSPNGIKIFIGPLFGSFTAPWGYGYNVAVASPFPMNGERLDNIGELGFEDVSSNIGSATQMFIDVLINIGFYAEYAEFDMDKLTCDCKKNIQFEY